MSRLRCSPTSRTRRRCARASRAWSLVAALTPVILASNLINALAAVRTGFLATCRHHSDLVVVEGLPLRWQPQESESQLGAVRSRLRVERIEGPIVRGAVEYTSGSRHWRHHFAMHVFTDQDAL